MPIEPISIRGNGPSPLANPIFQSQVDKTIMETSIAALDTPTNPTPPSLSERVSRITLPNQIPSSLYLPEPSSDKISPTSPFLVKISGEFSLLYIPESDHILIIGANSQNEAKRILQELIDDKKLSDRTLNQASLCNKKGNVSYIPLEGWNSALNLHLTASKLMDEDLLKAFEGPEKYEEEKPEEEAEKSDESLLEEQSEEEPEEFQETALLDHPEEVHEESEETALEDEVKEEKPLEEESPLHHTEQILSDKIELSYEDRKKLVEKFIKKGLISKDNVLVFQFLSLDTIIKSIQKSREEEKELDRVDIFYEILKRVISKDQEKHELKDALALKQEEKHQFFDAIVLEAYRELLTEKKESGLPPFYATGAKIQALIHHLLHSKSHILDT